MKVDILTAPDPACDDFVTANTNGRLAYTYHWTAAAARAVALKYFYLVAREGLQVYGVLPLAYINNFLFGNYMVSSPFSDYGGPLAVNDPAKEVLFASAVGLAEKYGCKWIEFRNLQPLPFDLTERKDKITMYLPLTRRPDDLWNSFDPKVRNQVRKATKSNVISLNGHVELLNDFYLVYTARMHELGTPSYPKGLIRNLLVAFPSNSRIFIVRLDGKTIGAALTFYFNGFVEIPLAGTLTAYNKLCPNMILYWSIMEHYCKTGARLFDLGRCSTEGPTYQFKKQWGAQPVQLGYQYWVRPGTELSILSPDNPVYKKKIQIWRRLPLWFVRLVSPVISRNLV
jgi:FemAB-related protein (PEP-CTERM system-associated)